MPRADVGEGGGSGASRTSPAPPRSDWILLPLKKAACSVSRLCVSCALAGSEERHRVLFSVSGSVSLGVRQGRRCAPALRHECLWFILIFIYSFLLVGAWDACCHLSLHSQKPCV